MAKLYNQFDGLQNKGNDLHGDHAHMDDTEPTSIDKFTDPGSNGMDDGMDDMGEDTTSDSPFTFDPIYSTERKKHNHFTDEDDLNEVINKKIVIGILTEPLTGTLRFDNDKVVGEKEYIPSADVKFVEQTGAKVIPVSYK
jgi:hypothetical protein